MNLEKLSNEDLLELKKKTKSQIVQYKILQLTRKVQLNSAYGACGNMHFRFFDTRLAEGITLCGQYVIQKLERDLNLYLSSLYGKKDYVIASDTDSLYLNLNSYVKTLGNIEEIDKVNQLDEHCKTEIQKQINLTCQRIHDYLHCFENKMVMKRENIANRGIWTKKKRYILNVWDSEGVRYSKPKIKITGIESVRSSTPQICRAKIKDTIELIMNKTQDDVIEFIYNFKQEFKTLPAEEVATPRGMNKLAKYYSSTGFVKKAPVQVKAALIYNRLIEKMKLEKNYQYIPEGTKGKFVYLRTPNPIGQKVIGFVNILPKEFDLDDFINYNKQFETGYLNPIKKILDAIKWKTEKTYDISSFMEFDDLEPVEEEKDDSVFVEEDESISEEETNEDFNDFNAEV